MRKALAITAILVVVLIVVGIVSLFSLYEASQQVPEFYREALSREPDSQEDARDEFIAQVAALASDLNAAGRWQRMFTADQINAWLALDLADDYPELLSGRLRDPRINIGDKEATIACRFDQGSVTTVLSLTVDAYLQEPNVLALRIRRARAGTLPVPLAQVLDGISHAAAELKLRLQWRKDHGDPVALISFSQAPDSDTSAVELETVDLRGGELFVAGTVGQHKDDVVKVKSDADDGARTADENGDDSQPLVGAAPKETRQE